MPHPRYHTINWSADIQGGDYPMAGLLAPARAASVDGSPGWRVVAIPGTPSRDYMFRRMLARAPDDIEVVMPTRAGYGGAYYGRAARPPVLDLDQQVRAIAPLFDKQDGRRTIVMGVSYGGALAFKCAIDYPDLIEGVLSVAALAHEPRAYVRWAIGLGGVPGIYHALPQYLKNARAEIAGRRSQIGSVFDRLNCVSQPVTILHGNRDTLVPLSAAQDLLDLLGPGGDVEFHKINNGTHYLELERPNMIYREIEALKHRINT